MYLDAVGAADVPCDDPHAILVDPENARIDRLHHMRRLAGIMHGQLLIDRIPVGDIGARLNGHTSVAGELERCFDHRVGRIGKGRIRIADVDEAFPSKIAVECVVNFGFARFERLLHVERGRHRRIFDIDERQRIFRIGAAVGDRHDDRFALPAGDVDRQRRLRRRT